MLIGQPPSEQFVAQPDAVGVHDIALAIVGDFADLSLPIVFLDFTAVYSGRLAGQPHHPGHFVQGCLALGTERSQDPCTVTPGRARTRH